MADAAPILKKAFVAFPAAFLVLGLAFFLPAGTLDYWQAWMYIATLVVPAIFVVAYFMVNDPEFLARRSEFKEKEVQQRKIIGLSTILFIIGFVMPGLDRRFGWSQVPPEACIAADALVLISYTFIFLVFRENRYAARTVRVEKGQQVITTGPYSVIRHPMYFGVLFMYLATPLALGSYWALIPFLGIVPALVFRILNEEEVLSRELPGYKEYCAKVKYRLVPLIW